MWTSAWRNAIRGTQDLSLIQNRGCWGRAPRGTGHEPVYINKMNNSRRI